VYYSYNYDVHVMLTIALAFGIFEDVICEVEVIAARASPRTGGVYQLFLLTVIYCVLFFY